MAYTAGNLVLSSNLAPGRNTYRYDSTDHPDVVEAANYFNNVTHDLNLAKGDIIEAVTWSATPFAAASTISNVTRMIVTNVISRDDTTSAKGRVNVAQILVAGPVSSLT
jgi:hypothetical protein